MSLTPIEVIAVSALFTLVTSTVAWFLARRDKKDDRTHSSTAPGAPTVQQVWERQDRMERGMKAALVIIGELAEQWDGSHPPKLSKRAIDTLRELDYLPIELDHLLPEQEAE